MSYTNAEIKNIQQLARDANLNNVLLAFELIRGRGIVPALVTDVYWIYNRMLWAKELDSQLAAQQLLQQARPQKSIVVPLLESISTLKKNLHPQFETTAQQLHLDRSLLATLYRQIFDLDTHPINSFLFKYGSTTLQQQILPFLKKREHTGRFLLDLGGFKLGQLPEVVLKEKNVQILKIWGNELQELPDFWDSFKLLETLNIADNRLASFPPSFKSLQKLQKLYAQGNAFDVETILPILKTLPKLKRLKITSPVEGLQHYTSSEYDTLRKLEELVEHGKMHASEKEQLLILGLHMNHPEALKQIRLIDLFEALSAPNEVTRIKAKIAILNWNNSTFDGHFPANASVAILGMVSFATRSRLNRDANNNIHYTTEITSHTTHIVVGDYPDNYAAVEDRPFIFITEEDLPQL